MITNGFVISILFQRTGKAEISPDEFPSFLEETVKEYFADADNSQS